MSYDSREFEFADTQVSMLGLVLSALRGNTYKRSQEKELVYGAGNQPRAIQRGNKKNEGTLTVLKSDFDLMDATARAAGYDGIIDVPGHLINITNVYQKPNTSMISTDTQINVEFTDAEDGMKQGDKFKEVALPYIYLRHKKA